MFLLTKTGPVYYAPPYYDILLSFIGQSGIVFLRCARSSPYTYYYCKKASHITCNSKYFCIVVLCPQNLYLSRIYYCKKHPVLHVTPSTFEVYLWRGFCVHRVVSLY